MTLTPRRRRFTDRLIAAGIVVVVGIVGLTIYLTSDIRATTDDTGPVKAVPSPVTSAPKSLTVKWSAETDAGLGAVVSASGVVVTTDRHTVTAHDSVTGAVRWSYGRSNVPLCAVGSGDVDTTPNGVTGILTVYEKNGFCSQLMSLDAVTGARSKVRTSPLPTGGSVAFGGPYAGWLSSDLVEVWRNDLVRTFQYGNLPNPTNPGTAHLGCVFSDLALADTQLATIEHCSDQGSHARVVLNFDDPGAVADHPTGWDQFKHQPRADIDTGSDAARIVGLTSDRVAVLVATPQPAVVLYDAAGSQISRTPVSIPAADIVAAAKSVAITPATRTDDRTISLIGSHLLSISREDIQGPAPATSLTTSVPTSSTVAPTSAAQVNLSSLRVDWTAAGALGLPALVGDQVLMPVDGGLSVFSADAGPGGLGAAGASTVTVDRSGFGKRVDVAAVGAVIVEHRGNTVVALA